MSHAKLFQPSSAFRWMSCTKSLTLPPKEETTNKFAQRGTSLHAMAEDLLSGKQLQLSYDDYVPTEEDIETVVKPYVEYVENIKASHGFYEQKVFLSEECYGTVDALLYDEPTKVMHVIDLKCGQTMVYAENNKQLAIYSIGGVNFLRSKGFIVDKIITHIFQPTIDNVKDVEVFKQDLKEIRKDVLQVIEDVQEGNVKFEASGSNCKWCPHVADCPEVLKMANQVAVEDFSDEMTLSDKYKMVKVLKAFISKVEEMTFIALDTGEKVPGFKLKDGHKRRKWKDEKKMIEHFVMNGVIGALETKIMSVAKVEKLLKEQKVDMELDDFIEFKQNKPSIVAESTLQKKK